MSNAADELLPDIDSLPDAQSPTPPPSPTASAPPPLHQSLTPLLTQIQTEPPTHTLVTTCSQTITQIDDEITTIHKTVQKLYSPRFPELETLISNPVLYSRIAHLTAPLSELSGLDFSALLPPATNISVQVTAASSTGRALQKEEHAQVKALCESVFHLAECRDQLLEYVEQQILHIAPNLVQVVSGRIAAVLLSFTGGLHQLANMPSGNLKVLGKGMKEFEAGGVQRANPHHGVIYTCPLILSLAPKYRAKGGNVVAGKASIAARVDLHGESGDGGVGKQLRQGLEEKFEKWQELPPAKTAKPLPVPGDEAKRKHRGGKRARRDKQRFAMSEARRMANRVSFGQAEMVVGNDLESEGLGVIGVQGSNRLGLHIGKAETIRLAARKKLVKERKKRNGNESIGLDMEFDFTPSQPSGQQDVQNAKPSFFSTHTPFVALSKPK